MRAGWTRFKKNLKTTASVGLWGAVTVKTFDAGKLMNTVLISRSVRQEEFLFCVLLWAGISSVDGPTNTEWDLDG